MSLRKFLILSFIVMAGGVMVLSSCGHSYDKRLEKIEDAVYDRPEEASALMADFNSSVDPADLSTHDRHLYDLLMAFDRYNSGIYDTVNPAVNTAAEYFERNKEWSKAGKSRFLIATYKFHGDHLPEGVVQSLSAVRGFSESGDSAWLARTYRQIGMIYEKMNDLASCARYYERSRDLFKEIGDAEYYPYTLMGIAEARANQDLFSEARALSMEACEWGREHNDTSVLMCGYRLMIDISESTDSALQALAYFDSLKNLGDEYVSSWDIENRGEAAYKAGDIKLARECADSIKGKENAGDLIQMLQLHDEDYEGALETVHRMVDYQNTKVVEIWHRDFASIINEYYDALLREEEQARQIERYKMILVLIISAIVIILVIVGVSIKIRRSRKEHQKIQAANESLKESIKNWIEQAQEDKNKINDYQAELKRLADEIKKKDAQYDSTLAQAEINHRESLSNFSRRLNMELLRFIGDFDGLRNKNKSERVEEKMNEFIDSLKSEESIARCVALANQAYGNIIDDFDEAFPDYDELYRKIFLYNVLQLPVPLQIMLLEIKDNKHYRNRKYYLKGMISKSGHPKAALFLRFLPGHL